MIPESLTLKDMECPSCNDNYFLHKIDCQSPKRNFKTRGESAVLDNGTVVLSTVCKSRLTTARGCKSAIILYLGLEIHWIELCCQARYTGQFVCCICFCEILCKQPLSLLFELTIMTKVSEHNSIVRQSTISHMSSQVLNRFLYHFKELCSKV